MRTLLERLKPELATKLEIHKVEYPNIAAEVVDHLGKTYIVSDLRYGTFMDLKSLWMQVTGSLVDSPWEFFKED